ncbi:hypothetical protein Cgig2_017651 [Carnegiea gigantea]|uniref:Uncharacterized protein n=1 Tax=Carnegiea gigantea TaxID=171969 RepID=A0A9Q1KCP0_9CARY|nr:hypothetical protein Cgig2_017651 [Carnegiea gigantea]
MMKFKGKGQALGEVLPATCKAAPAVFGVPANQGFGHQQTSPPHGEEEKINCPLFPSIGWGRSRRLIVAALRTLALANGQAYCRVRVCTFLACWFTGHRLSSSKQRSASATTYTMLAFPVLKMRLPVTRLAFPPLRPLHRLYHLSYELWDGSGLIVLLHEVMEIAGCLILLSFSNVSPTRLPTDKEEVILLMLHLRLLLDGHHIALPEYHPKSLVPLGALWTECLHMVKRKPKAVIEGSAVEHDAFSGWLIHCHIHFGDYESTPCGQEEDALPEEELVLVKDNSATALRKVGQNRDYLGCPQLATRIEISCAKTEDTSSRRILAARPQGSVGLKKKYPIGNIIRFPTLIFWGNACNPPAIDKGREARELQMAAHHLGADQFFRNIPAG